MPDKTKKDYFEKLESRVKRKLEQQNVVLAKPIQIQHKRTGKKASSTRLNITSNSFKSKSHVRRPYVVKDSRNNVISCLVKKNFNVR